MLIVSRFAPRKVSALTKLADVQQKQVHLPPAACRLPPEISEYDNYSTRAHRAPPFSPADFWIQAPPSNLAYVDPHHHRVIANICKCRRYPGPHGHVLR